MFSRRLTFFTSNLVVGLAAAILLAACSNDVLEEEQISSEQTELDEQQISEGKADNFFWPMPQNVDFRCDSTINGQFGGREPMHIYMFSGQAGYKYDFTFIGKYPMPMGAQMIVANAKNRRQIASKQDPRSNTVSVSINANNSTKYLIAVFAPRNMGPHSGPGHFPPDHSAPRRIEYTLSAKCTAPQTPQTCTKNSDCGSPANYCRFDQGCGRQQPGVCDVRPQACTRDLNPVCGCDGQTYSNACLAKANGVSVDRPGQCQVTPPPPPPPVEGQQCASQGGYCTHFLTPCRYDYLSSSPSDCPMGRSGKCCLPPAPTATKCEAQGGYCTYWQAKCQNDFLPAGPADCPHGRSAQCCLPPVTIDNLKKGYEYNSGSMIELNPNLHNNYAEDIFLAGCSTYSWEKMENNQWVNKGSDKICVWEGVAKQVALQSTYVETLTMNGEGTYRLVAGYSLGCTPGKPISQAGCREAHQVYSPQFTVKTCLNKNMPNPQSCGGVLTPQYDEIGVCVNAYKCCPLISQPAPSFCAGGKIMPGYDAEGVCITRYLCVK